MRVKVSDFNSPTVAVNVSFMVALIRVGGAGNAHSFRARMSGSPGFVKYVSWCRCMATMRRGGKFASPTGNGGGGDGPVPPPRAVFVRVHRLRLVSVLPSMLAAVIALGVSDAGEGRAL